MSSSAPNSSEKSNQSSPALPYRFSLRALFRLTTCLAVVLAFAVVMPESLNRIVNGAVWIAGAGWLVTGLVYARGDQRAFCIGAAVVVSSIWTGVGGRYMQGFHLLYGPRQLIDISPLLATWVDLLVIAATAILNGIFCVYARRYFGKNARE